MTVRPRRAAAPRESQVPAPAAPSPADRPLVRTPVAIGATLLAALLATSASVPTLAADGDVEKVGILLGFTGPVESLTPPMAAAAELAFAEVNDSGLLLEGTAIEAVRGDSTCTDAGAATAAAERLVTAERVAAILGAACSGVTIAVVNGVAVPNGVPMVSPSATSPALATIEDDGLFARVVPSDGRQGEVLADVVRERGFDTVALTYTNNDYGKGFADAFTSAFEGGGGTVAITAAHEDGKGDYSAEVGALAAAGADALVVLGYVDQGGKGIVQAAVDADAFDAFFGGDGMVGPSIVETLGEDIEGFVTTLPGTQSDGGERFAALATEAGIEPSGVFIPESYDAAALIALAMQKAGSGDRAAIAAALADVANAPGEPILPGELGKALEILAGGGDVDYVGATDVELDEAGETAGSYKEQEVREGEFAVIGYR